MTNDDSPEMLVVHESATAGEPTDRLPLTWELRRKSRLKATTAGGRSVGLFLPRGTVLFDGSLLRRDARPGREMMKRPQAQGLEHFIACPAVNRTWRRRLVEDPRR